MIYKMSEFSCSVCQYTSDTKKSVKRHIDAKCVRAEIIEIPIDINCEYCTKSFTTIPNLKKHLKICKIKKDQAIKKQLEAKQITTIDNFMYILQEREFIHAKQNVYKLGITGAVRTRMNSYPKGSKVFCVMPVEGDPETKCLRKFRERFTSRVDIGSEYFEGEVQNMINTLLECCN